MKDALKQLTDIYPNDKLKWENEIEDIEHDKFDEYKGEKWF